MFECTKIAQMITHQSLSLTDVFIPLIIFPNFHVHHGGLPQQRPWYIFSEEEIQLYMLKVSS